MRSYRKLAVQWHPDHYEGDDKKKAEKMFIDIAAAKEVLSDPGRKTILLRISFSNNHNTVTMIVFAVQPPSRIDWTSGLLSNMT